MILQPPHENADARGPRTVGQLIAQLQDHDPDLPVFLAINPYWPFTHHIGTILRHDGPHGATAYIAEAGQHSYLPLEVRSQLGWTP